jgi:hypothetical protein
MNAKTAEMLLQCYRPGKKVDPRIIKAVRFAEGDETLRRMLDDQMDFDEQVVEAIHSIKPPENLRAKLGEITAATPEARPPARVRWFQPAVLAVVLGVLLIVGVGVWIMLEGSEDFSGKAAVEKLLAVPAGMNGTELEPIELPAGQLGDKVYMKGFEGFALPAEFANAPAVGWRVFTLQGHRVAQLAIDRHSAILFVFRASDFGIRIDGTWRVIDKDQWTGAVKEQDGLCTLVAFRGDKAEMQQFIQSQHP